MTARVCSLAVAVLLFASALGAAPARAEVDAAERAKAAAHFKQAQAYFQRADFDRALTEYQAAYDRSSEPSLIFNIALCHDRANRPEDALRAFLRYLELAPEGPVADEARDDVARLTPIVDQLVAERAAEQARQREAAARRVSPSGAPPPPPSPPSRVPRYLVATGAAVAVIGAAAHALAWRTRDRLVGAPDPDAYFSDRDTFKLERGVAIGAYAAGAITIATGLVLGRTVFARDDGPQISAMVTSSSAAVTVEWSR